jgi:hypothetical protein
MALALGDEMMRKFLGLAALGLALSACSSGNQNFGNANTYFERKDTVTFSAGDAVAWNNAQQITNPTPAGAYNNNISTDGRVACKSVEKYVKGSPPANNGSGSLISVTTVVNNGGGGGEGGGGSEVCGK